MSRVKSGTTSKLRHKRLLKQASGYWGQRSNIFRRANETRLRAMAFEFKSRKLIKRDFRSLFIKRVKVSAEAHGLKYSRFINLIKKSNIELNRKVLSQISILDPAAFEAVVSISKQNI
jgi:large subunit ribosomal protein L20